MTRIPQRPPLWAAFAVFQRYFLSFPLSRTLPICGAESTEEDGVIPEPRVLGGLEYRYVTPDRLGGLLQTLLTDVLMNGTAVDLLEPVHQIVAAEKESPCQPVDAQFLAQMRQNIAGYLLHFGVKPVGRRVCLLRRGADGPIQSYQQLQYAGIRQKP